LRLGGLVIRGLEILLFSGFIQNLKLITSGFSGKYFSVLNRIVYFLIFTYQNIFWFPIEEQLCFAALLFPRIFPGYSALWSEHHPNQFLLVLLLLESVLLLVFLPYGWFSKR